MWSLNNGRVNTEKTSETVIDNWRKDCDCKGTSSAGQYRSKEEGHGMEYINMTVYYYVGLSCDICGKPWKQNIV